MNKIIYIIVGIIVIIAAVSILTSKFRETVEVNKITETKESLPEGASAWKSSRNDAYTISADSGQSINWSGKKPLILGYVDSGTIPVKSGEIKAREISGGAGYEITGEFVFDVENLQVGLVAKKPGQEGNLAKHLKSDAFFNVEKYSTAKFEITNLTPRDANPEGDEYPGYEGLYTIAGNLTIKDISQTVLFPATFYLLDGKLHLKAETKIDRTKWDMTFASGNFFQNLGDGLVDDMVDISFDLTMSAVEVETDTEEGLEAI